jgi:hypothetical protein
MEADQPGQTRTGNLGADVDDQRSEPDPDQTKLFRAIVDHHLFQIEAVIARLETLMREIEAGRYPPPRDADRYTAD